MGAGQGRWKRGRGRTGQGVRRDWRGGMWCGTSCPNGASVPPESDRPGLFPGVRGSPWEEQRPLAGSLGSRGHRAQHGLPECWGCFLLLWELACVLLGRSRFRRFTVGSSLGSGVSSPQGFHPGCRYLFRCDSGPASYLGWCQALSLARARPGHRFSGSPS